jgi:hypothetical protein
MKFTRYETSALKIRVFDATAVVTGRLQRSRKVDDRAFEDDWQFTKVYARRGGKWLVVAFHASDFKP